MFFSWLSPHCFDTSSLNYDIYITTSDDNHDDICFLYFQMTPLLWAQALSYWLVFVHGVQLVCCFMLVITAGFMDLWWTTISVYTCWEERWGLTVPYSSFWKIKAQLNWFWFVKAHFLMSLVFFSNHKLLCYCWAQYKLKDVFKLWVFKIVLYILKTFCLTPIYR